MVVKEGAAPSSRAYQARVLAGGRHDRKVCCLSQPECRYQLTVCKVVVYLSNALSRPEGDRFTICPASLTVYYTMEH